jgi:hypothetical protein
MAIVNRWKRAVIAALLGVPLIGAGVVVLPSAASAAPTPPGYGSILDQIQGPGGGLANGYCLTAKGPAGSFTTAGSGTDGHVGEINQANVPAGRYTGVIYDCGAGTGATSNGNITFTVTANTQFSATYVLVLGGSIVGSLLDSVTGGPAVAVSVTAVDSARNIVLATACSDSSGNFSFGNLPDAGVKVKFGGGGANSACSNDKVYTATWYGGTSFATATVVMPISVCCGTQLNPTTLVSTGGVSKNGKVTITGVTFSGSASAPVFTVTGSGFGKLPNDGTAPVCPETAGAGFIYGGQIYFNDNSSAQWQAGFGNDCIGIIPEAWSDTSITFILGSWYSGPGAAQGTALNPGDPYTMTVRGAKYVGVVNL